MRRNAGRALAVAGIPAEMTSLLHALESNKAQGGCPGDEKRFAASLPKDGGAKDEALKRAGNSKRGLAKSHNDLAMLENAENREVAERQAGWAQADKALRVARKL